MTRVAELPATELMTEASERREPFVFAAVYREHAAFVWRSLRRLGVREADAEDVAQDVFLVVHKKLAEFRGERMKSWIFAIAVRVAADYRKRAYVRNEITEPPAIEPSTGETQTATLDRERAIVLLESVLAALDDDKRAVFIAYELEGLPMAEIAASLDCPLQTAYSRLHAAREQIRLSIERWKRQSGEGS